MYLIINNIYLNNFKNIHSNNPPCIIKYVLIFKVQEENIYITKTNQLKLKVFYSSEDFILCTFRSQRFVAHSTTSSDLIEQ